MTTNTDTANIPMFTRGDRMAKALEHSRVTVSEMADYLGVSRQTIGNWMHGRTQPSKGDLRLWAMRTGVPLEWIETGRTGSGAPRGGGQLPHLDSNEEPCDYLLSA